MRILAATFAYNEGEKIRRTIARHPQERPYDLLVMDDGSTDGSLDHYPRTVCPCCEIPRLLQPILDGEADFVQGSRFLPGGGYGNTPAYRVLATRYVHPLLFSLSVGKRVTETTNGFRAFRTVILRDARIRWRQDWLNQYEFEPYLLYQAIKLGYRHCEVPVTKIYPPHAQGYTKMRPIIGWWSILRPIILLGLGLRK